MIKKQIQDLLALQEIDLRIRDLNVRLKTIELERKKTVMGFEQEKRRLAAAKKEVLLSEQEIKGIQAKEQEEKDKLQNLQIQSLNIKKNTEYEIMLNNIASTKERISDYETKELEAWDEHDKLEQYAAEEEKKYMKIGRKAKADVLALDETKEKTLLEIQEKTQASENARQLISANYLPKYLRMINSGNGKPVNLVDDRGTCPHCGLSLPQQTLNALKSGNLLECDNCSFFIFKEI